MVACRSCGARCAMVTARNKDAARETKNLERRRMREALVCLSEYHAATSVFRFRPQIMLPLCLSPPGPAQCVSRLM